MVYEVKRSCIVAVSREQADYPSSYLAIRWGRYPGSLEYPCGVMASIPVSEAGHSGSSPGGGSYCTYRIMVITWRCQRRDPSSILGRCFSKSAGGGLPHSFASRGINSPDGVVREAIPLQRQRRALDSLFACHG